MATGAVKASHWISRDGTFDLCHQQSWTSRFCSYYYLGTGFSLAIWHGRDSGPPLASFEEKQSTAEPPRY